MSCTVSNIYTIAASIPELQMGNTYQLADTTGIDSRNIECICLKNNESGKAIMQSFGIRADLRIYDNATNFPSNYMSREQSTLCSAKFGTFHSTGTTYDYYLPDQNFHVLGVTDRQNMIKYTALLDNQGTKYGFYWWLGYPNYYQYTCYFLAMYQDGSFVPSQGQASSGVPPVNFAPAFRLDLSKIEVNDNLIFVK